MIQIAVPTREKVDAYAELRSQVNELVGRINVAARLARRSAPSSRSIAASAATSCSRCTAPPT